ncbi:DUF1080 domain-containing protein [bacterium]|nr:DUF1080 domain-containing protein [bacterium]
MVQAKGCLNPAPTTTINAIANRRFVFPAVRVRPIADSSRPFQSAMLIWRQIWRYVWVIRFSKNHLTVMRKTISTFPFQSASRAGSRRISVAFSLLLAGVFSASAADTDPFTLHKLPPIGGRWDLQVHDGNQTYPSWLEVKQSGFRTLVGTYVGQFGSARPIAEIHYNPKNDSFHFTIPPQWEHRTSEITFHGKINRGNIEGDTTNDAGKTIHWDGHRAPSLDRDKVPNWGQPVELFDGTDLTGWKARNPDARNGWQIRDGVLVNAEPGNDIVTEKTFNDFKLHAEFRYPKGSNSGIYLRGRYEVQIEDDYGLEPESHHIGGVYGFLTPRVNAAKPAGEWQTMDITLVGRVVTVVLNGEPIIERQAIPGITGGALDSDEEKPGPILVQGDHGQVEFRKLTLTPEE